MFERTFERPMRLWSGKRVVALLLYFEHGNQFLNKHKGLRPLKHAMPYQDKDNPGSLFAPYTPLVKYRGCGERTI